MSSNINTAIPPFGSPTTAGVRNNFTAAKSEIEALQGAIGFVDYNDLATTTVPISVSPATWTKLTNDKLGPFTKIDALPSGVTSLWNSTTNQISLTELPLNSMVNARYDITVTTTAANQTVNLSVFLGIGSPSEYESPKLYAQFKTAGTYPLTVFTGSYIGSNDIKNFPAEIRLKSDASCTVRVNGWYFQILKKV